MRDVVNTQHMYYNSLYFICILSLIYIFIILTCSNQLSNSKFNTQLLSKSKTLQFCPRMSKTTFVQDISNIMMYQLTASFTLYFTWRISYNWFGYNWFRLRIIASIPLTHAHVSSSCQPLFSSKVRLLCPLATR
jgi:hypothetical protein